MMLNADLPMYAGAYDLDVYCDVCGLLGEPRESPQTLLEGVQALRNAGWNIKLKDKRVITKIRCPDHCGTRTPKKASDPAPDDANTHWVTLTQIEEGTEHEED